MKNAREREKGGEHGDLSSLGRRRGRPSSPEREETKKKKTERRREAAGLYIKGEGHVWFC